jgi:ABC-type transporter MlaC component
MVGTSNDADPAVRSLGRGFDSRRSWLGRLTWRTLGGGTLVLLIGAPLSPTLAQSASPTPPSAVPSTIAAPAKPATAKTAAKKPDSTPPAEKIAADATKAKSKDKQLAATPTKHEEPKKLAATPKKPEPKQIADAAPKTPSLPSYTITTTRNHVTYTTTRVVPLQATPAPATKVAAVVPVSLTQPVEHLAAQPEKPAAMLTAAESPAAAPPPASAPAPAPTTVTAAPITVAALPPTPPPAPAAPPATTPAPQAAAPAPVLASAALKAVTPTHAASPAPTTAKTQPATLTVPPIIVTAPQPTPASPVATAIAVTLEDSTPAANFVATFLNDAFRVARSAGTSSLQRRAQLADLFAGKMDVKLIAGYTTADELTEMSSDLQQRFRTILISYLVETYYPRLELASDPSVTVDTIPATPLSDGTAVVWTTFSKEGWGTQSVKWRLAAEKDGFKIVDIYSAGASLVQMERDTFLSVMRNGGVPELMAKLDQRTKALASAATE